MINNGLRSFRFSEESPQVSFTQPKCNPGLFCLGRVTSGIQFLFWTLLTICQGITMGSIVTHELVSYTIYRPVFSLLALLEFKGLVKWYAFCQLKCSSFNLINHHRIISVLLECCRQQFVVSSPRKFNLKVSFQRLTTIVGLRSWVVIDALLVGYRRLNVERLGVGGQLTAFLSQ